MKVAIPTPEGYIEVNQVDGYEPLLFRQKIEDGDVYIGQINGVVVTCMDSVGQTPESYGLDVEKSWIYRPAKKTQEVYIGQGKYATVKRIEGWNPLEEGDEIKHGDWFMGKTLNTACTGAIGHDVIAWMGPEPTFRDNWIYRQQARFVPPWAQLKEKGYWTLLTHQTKIQPGDIAINSDAAMNLDWCRDNPNDRSYLDGKVTKHLICNKHGYGNGAYTVIKLIELANAKMVYRWIPNGQPFEEKYTKEELDALEKDFAISLIRKRMNKAFSEPLPLP